MCGIIGGVGKLDYRKFLLSGLKKLDYRGYDSAGLAFLKNKEISLYKVAGRVEDLAKIVPDFTDAEAGIAHTRWATHGEPNKDNAHPHFSMNKVFYIVHNGVIENFRSLKNLLKSEGYTFHTETDTEIIADLLEVSYLKKRNVLSAISETMRLLQGSYACAILCKNEPDLYFMVRST